MQFPQSIDRMQLPLFQGNMLVDRPSYFQVSPLESACPASDEAFSELTLRGSAESCLSLLAPMLRELSQQTGNRWLTLIDAPATVTQAWLRSARINRDRVLLLQSRGMQPAIELACEALRIGRSHTVISWINSLDGFSRKKLIAAAQTGQTESLNIRLG